MRACNLIIVLVSHYQADEAQLIWTYMKRFVFSQHGLLRTSIKYLIFNPFPKRYIQSWTPNLARLVFGLIYLFAAVNSGQCLRPGISNYDIFWRSQALWSVEDSRKHIWLSAGLGSISRQTGPFNLKYWRNTIFLP